MKTIIEIKKVCYEHDLPEGDCMECGDDSIVTHLIVNEEYILSGDEYHDDITAQIKGFLFALKHFKIDYEKRS